MDKDLDEMIRKVAGFVFEHYIISSGVDAVYDDKMFPYRLMTYPDRDGMRAEVVIPVVHEAELYHDEGEQPSQAHDEIIRQVMAAVDGLARLWVAVRAFGIELNDLVAKLEELVDAK